MTREIAKREREKERESEKREREREREIEREREREKERERERVVAGVAENPIYWGICKTLKVILDRTARSTSLDNALQN